MWVRLCVAAVTLSGIGGCDQVSEVGGVVADRIASIGAPPDATSEGIRTLALLGGDVSVRGPEGYCIDQGASNARRGFAVMVGCALLSDDAAVMPSLDGLITVQFGDEDTASVANNEDAFAAFLQTDLGRALLAADGNASSIENVLTQSDDGAVMVRFDDMSNTGFAATQGPQWRGFQDVQSRLVTVSVLTFERNGLTQSEGERLLRVAMSELTKVNTIETATEENG